MRRGRPGRLAYFEDNGLLPYWRQHVGHAIGLRNHEAPFLDVGDHTPVEPGMVFTIEPGLYFQIDDVTVPEEYRGIGVRIEDDVLMTEGGPVNLSADIPRTADEVEAWVQRLNA